MIKPPWETDQKPPWESEEVSSFLKPPWERPEFKQSQFPAMSTSDIQANVKQKLGIDLAPGSLPAPVNAEGVTGQNKEPDVIRFNEQSPFYNAPLIGNVLKRNEEKTTEVAKNVLTPEELDIFKRGYQYNPTFDARPGNITIASFRKNQDIVPADVLQRFNDVYQKVEYAKKSGLEKFMDRTARQMVRTAVGEKGAQETAEAYGVADAGKVGNVAGDITGTILGYLVPSGGGSNPMQGANVFGEHMVRAAGTKAPFLVKSPLVQRMAQGLVEDIPLTAYTAMTERQTPGEAAKTFALNAPFTIGGELAKYGLGELAGKLIKSKKPPMATPAQTPDFYVSPEGTAVRDIDLSRKLLTEGTPGPKGGLQEVVIDAYSGRGTPFTATKGELSGLKNTPNETDRLSTYIDYAVNVFKDYVINVFRAYYDDAMANRRELSEKQTRRVTGSENVKQAYEDLIRVRRIKSLVDKIKAIQKDEDMSDAEKTERINELSKQIGKLQK